MRSKIFLLLIALSSIIPITRCSAMSDIVPNEEYYDYRNLHLHRIPIQINNETTEDTIPQEVIKEYNPQSLATFCYTAFVKNDPEKMHNLLTQWPLPHDLAEALVCVVLSLDKKDIMKFTKIKTVFLNLPYQYYGQFAFLISSLAGNNFENEEKNGLLALLKSSLNDNNNEIMEADNAVIIKTIDFFEATISNNRLQSMFADALEGNTVPYHVLEILINHGADSNHNSVLNLVPQTVANLDANNLLQKLNLVICKNTNNTHVQLLKKNAQDYLSQCQNTQMDKESVDLQNSCDEPFNDKDIEKDREFFTAVLELIKNYEHKKAQGDSLIV